MDAHLKCTDRLDVYRNDGFKNVRGYLSDGIFDMLEAVAVTQSEINVDGPMFEIGVHRGQFFLGLENLKNSEHPSVAIDIFSMQELNIDKSGKGILSEFEDNYKSFAAYPDSIRPIEADSTQISSGFILEKMDMNKARISSIDGGHTAEHTVNDLRLAERTLANYGVCFLDDYYHSSWPGVHEGFARFMLFETPTLVPFAYDRGKLMLTMVSGADTLRDIYTKSRQKLSPSVKFQETKMYGHVVHKFV